MQFSDEFELTLNGSEDWFDPILSLDTKLFIDPLLVEEFEDDEFDGSHDEISAFFEEAFKLVASSIGPGKEQYYTRALDMLRFPEVEELCLGFTARGTDGGGAGKGKARTIAEAMRLAVERGVLDPGRFEAVQLFRKGIAEDTISDAVGNILKWRLAAYTQRICKDLNVPLTRKIHRRGRYSIEKSRWIPLEVFAPINRFNGHQILLCPKDFLGLLPTVNPDTYWHYWYDKEAERLKREFGDSIKRKVNKEVIRELALQDFPTVEEFIEFVAHQDVAAYDIEADPKALIKWYRASKSYVAQFADRLQLTSEPDFTSFIDMLLKEFEEFVLLNRGWELLYNDDGSPRAETVCQTAFLGLVKFICHLNNIDISKEANIGRGPVDFKFSRGTEYRALVEVKLAKNTKFWHGLKTQLPLYQRAEGVSVGRFLVVAFDQDELERIKKVQEIAAEVAKDVGYDLSAFVVRAEYKPPSASTA